MNNNIEQAPNVEIISSPKIFEYSNFWIRFVAYIIDAILVGFLTGALARFGGASGAIGSIFITGVYYVIMETSDYQGTLGKMAMGLKVTDLEGNKLTYQKSIFRFLATFLSKITILIGYIIAAFTEKKQALHDIIAGTLVIKK
jgi:uncharacterized RDD family membrane protein YckC